MSKGVAIDFERLSHFPPREEDVSYTARDTILYALGIGLGFEPVDERQLRFVYERSLVAFPTIAMAIGHPGWWLGAAGLDPERVVHAAKRMEVLSPMPPAGTVHTRSVVTGVVDKGPGKAALIHTMRDIWDKPTGRHLSRQLNTIMARGQGGFGGPNSPAPAPLAMPARAPDIIGDIPTLPQQALLFRLSGDLHPVHVDPAFARRSGFQRPVLHGLATMAIAAHLVLREVCAYDVARVTAVECRFMKPVFPGDVISTEMWIEDAQVLFQCRVRGRDEVVLGSGLLELRPAADRIATT